MSTDTGSRIAEELASSSVHDTEANHRIARWVASVAGLLGVLLAVATPLLPVDQTTAQLNWPQNGSFGSVEAPLIGYVATDLNITVPCQAAAGLAGRGNPGKTVLLSTVPKQAPKAVDRGLLIVRANDDLVLVVRNVPVVTAPLSQVLGPACQRLTFTAHADKVTAEFVGLTQGPNTEHPGAPLRGEKSGYDFRPQIVGVFTDLSGPAPPGLSFSATIDTRYSSSPTPLKMAAMILGLVLTGAALVALHILDTADGTRHRRFLPARWWSIGGLDALVIAVLTWWHFVGANTSDDGYILTMARVSEHAGYMANYYRWFGTPEAPFGWYYDLLALWAHVSTTSIWMRLPTLAMALTCWWVISREVMPRLGHAVKQNRAAAWTAAGMFLAVWLPLDNGLRPEPIIALGILLTWCSVERAVATSRLLPVAVACIIGALTLFSGPTGIASIGALLVAIGPLRTILHRRITRFGALPLIAPLLAAATVTAILIFRDQTLAGEVQASMLKRAVGPSLSWFDEHIRYERLFMASPDGSVARRFAVLALVLALGVTVAMSLRKGRIPGTATGPSRRIVGITIISFVAMMFTPTKWTHHFGVFAGLAGPLGALAAVAVTAAAMRSRRNRTVYAAVVLFLVALSFASVNGWWYVSNFGVPWSNAFPAWHYAFATALLGLTVLVLLLAAWFHFVAPDDGPPKTRWGARLAGIIQSPLAIATWALVVFEVASLTLAMTDQYPAWSVGRSNLQALTGKTCGLAEDVLVEQDPSAGLLSPVGGPAGPSAAEALGAGLSEAFTANGIPADVRADPVMERPGDRSFVNDEEKTGSNQAGTEGGTTPAPGINGSSAQLPFNLDPARTPVLGSWRSGIQVPAHLRSGWYRLPARDKARPLLVVSAAGRFDPREVQVQWATDEQAASGHPGGSFQFADVGASPAWRNLRLPLSAIPAAATQVRLVADDEDLAPQHWIALTPPRIPQLRTLQDVVGSKDPVFLDWLVGLAFPCQRPFGHQNGVDETPKWRILPDRFGAEANSPVMDNNGGGPLGVTELLAKATTMATYLKDDWSRDWGSLQRLTPYYPDARPAQLLLGTATRSGLWNPAPLRH
ncbi:MULTISPECIES: arabinosyltransferase domain-containing protein [Mycobacterium avium complex (MAC)]|uniref:arabinosyltransferase domain-containing protein n=1 Tax=Mycobacterium avium complex (MAC) TaxID=120793 RepID=UPI000448215D|nr:MULTISPECIES: arabinosyltransferase domain-containing protein [Mycobacterium avium complex (MAC)]ETZ75808.1 putative arabinosyltransferase C [Mycobacterium sp. MAC_011194_8550]MBZ4573836.1 arabinosyltransferase [Mycobacterium avium subsp. hominissuis]MCA4730637.1 arabinosyltransferase [Mycobacterium avium subsp. hominissuis]MDO2356777.1 arabinosyltransferase domain-containing protein [Mycobacterium avium subsp. hominissuis]QBC83479.1 arabinosyltransferase [Mycobacterium avium subsp. hominis